MSKISIDLSGGRFHWLSPAGRRPANDAIHMKHRARHLAALAKRKPVSEATLAKSREIDKHLRSKEIARQLAAWSKAIMILDASEVMIRDLIETRLAGLKVIVYAGRVKVAQRIVAALMKDITAIRTKAIRTAFRSLRDKLAGRGVLRASLSRWAAAILRDDLRNIEQAIQTGLVEGLDNMDIARKIVGSLASNGIDGVTQYTRAKVATLGHVATKESKRRLTSRATYG